MAILGVYEGHNAGAALIDEGTGEVVAAVEEERFSRVKNHDSRLSCLAGPTESVQHCLSQTSEPVTAVALALEEPSALRRYAVNQFMQSVQSGDASRLACVGDAFDTYSDAFDWPKVTQEQRILKALASVQKAGVSEATPVVHVPHHVAHLASAYFTSPVDQALVVSLDGMGDGRCGMAALAAGTNLQTIVEIDFRHSIGSLYSAFAQACGYTVNRDEGKFTALAAYGDPDVRLYELVSRLCRIDDRTSGLIGRLNEGLALGPYPHTLFDEQTRRALEIMSEYDHTVVAATVQSFLEELVTSWVARLSVKAKVRQICLAGGVFTNVSLNRRLVETGVAEDLYVHPGVSDAGLALGAAMCVFSNQFGRRPYALESAFLGPSATSSEDEHVATSSGMVVAKPRDVSRVVAWALSQDYSVARCCGPAEYGPRALGNRSILAPATRADLPDRLNRQLRRTPVMPFAPATLIDDADALYEGWRSSAWSSRFMTVAFRCSTTMKRMSPAAVHVDGTARAQIIDARSNEGLHSVLSCYREFSGLPTIINTSLNLHEEPMALTPKDSVMSALTAQIPIIQLGEYICAANEEILESILRGDA